jgi:hypothetical protein
MGILSMLGGSMMHMERRTWLSADAVALGMSREIGEARPGAKWM